MNTMNLTTTTTSRVGRDERAILQISAGTGPREVREFVASLGDALTQLCAARGLELCSRASVGDEDAPSSVSLELRGVSLAALDDLLGTHALVRPRDSSRRRGRSKGSRKRWFAGVSLHRLPDAGVHAPVELDPRELDIRCDRAGGPGGQHVNTCASAVRIRHRPSGVAVRVASERSQHCNRQRALERLAALLSQRRASAHAEADARRRLAHHQLERGRPVASWRATTHRRGPTLERDGP